MHGREMDEPASGLAIKVGYDYLHVAVDDHAERRRPGPRRREGSDLSPFVRTPPPTTLLRTSPSSG